jgi:hypothetical protein
MVCFRKLRSGHLSVTVNTFHFVLFFVFLILSSAFFYGLGFSLSSYPPQLDNPTNVLVSAGSLTLDMLTPDGNTRIGNASIADFTITGVTIPPSPFGSSIRVVGDEPPSSSLTNLSAVSVVLTTDDMVLHVILI